MPTKSAKPKKSTKPSFKTASNSPFADGYDLNAEATVLKDLIEADSVDPDHPLFQRFAEYEERLARLSRIQQLKPVRQQQTGSLSQEVRSIGGLEAEENAEDSMTLQTRDAMKLFVGRPAEGGARAIAGGRRVAASLRQVWGLSSNDNPYADWMLVSFDEASGDVMRELAQQASAIVARMDGLRAKGLSYSVLVSKSPVVVQLGFTSPYGYAIARLMVEFDWLARVVKSAQRRDVLSSTEAYQILFSVKRKIRSVFEPIVRSGALMTREELRPLTRADFLSSDEDAKRRVLAMNELFGSCPKDVFVGGRAPRHARRSVTLSPAELALLDSVPLSDHHSVEETSGEGESGLIE